MAKKRNGSGSNLGLIVTLIFFVLSTTILGVTTYLGFSGQDDLAKAKEKAEKEKANADNDAKYQRMQNRALLVWLGMPPKGVDAAEVARDKAQFEKGQFAPASSQPDKDAVLALFKTLDQAMPWPANETAPATTYEKRVESLMAEAQKERATAAKAEAAAKRTEDERKELADAKDKEIAALKAGLEDVRKRAAADVQKALDMAATAQATAASEGATRGKYLKQADDASRSVAKLSGEVKDLQAKLLKETGEKRQAIGAAEDERAKREALQQRYGADPNALEAAQLDAQARKVLETWKKNWQIVGMDLRGESPFINLGSADGLQPQVTFSVHGLGPGDKLLPTPKGTVEVVRVLGPHRAQVRVTSVRDARKDPLVRGDRLFNPTWDPHRRRHVALAGIADLGGAGNPEANEDFRRLLRRQNAVLDAYIDAKDDKNPRVVGKVGVGTDYLVIGEGFDPTGSRPDKVEYSTRYAKLIQEMRDAAQANGVTVVSLRRYLDMIGYQAPRVSSADR